MDSKLLLDRFLEADDYEYLGKAVWLGYKLCHKLVMEQPALSAFPPGQYQFSYLIRTYVEWAAVGTLGNVRGWYYDFRPYAGQNGCFTRFTKRGLSVTAHYVGSGANKRPDTQRAICRSDLESHNLQLFEAEASRPDISASHGYCRVLHAGNGAKPESAHIAVPRRDHAGFYLPYELPLIEPAVAETEEVEEKLRIELNESIRPEIKEDSTG